MVTDEKWCVFIESQVCEDSLEDKKSKDNTITLFSFCPSNILIGEVRRSACWTLSCVSSVVCLIRFSYIVRRKLVVVSYFRSLFVKGVVSRLLLTDCRVNSHAICGRGHHLFSADVESVFV